MKLLTLQSLNLNGEELLADGSQFFRLEFDGRKAFFLSDADVQQLKAHHSNQYGEELVTHQKTVAKISHFLGGATIGVVGIGIVFGYIWGVIALVLVALIVKLGVACLSNKSQSPNYSKAMDGIHEHHAKQLVKCLADLLDHESKVQLYQDIKNSDSLRLLNPMKSLQSPHPKFDFFEHKLKLNCGELIVFLFNEREGEKNDNQNL